MVKNERFFDISTDAKLLYGLMLDRIALSLQNGWQDTEGRAFIYFTLEEIQATLSCGHNKAVRLLAELEQFVLIERVKQGQGKPAKIYVKKIPTADADSGEGTENDSILPEVADLQTSEKSTRRVPVSKRLDFPKGDENYTEAKRRYAKSKRTNPNKKQAKSPDSTKNQEICGRGEYFRCRVLRPAARTGFRDAARRAAPPESQVRRVSDGSEEMLKIVF